MGLRVVFEVREVTGGSEEFMPALQAILVSLRVCHLIL